MKGGVGLRGGREGVLANCGMTTGVSGGTPDAGAAMTC